MVLIIHSKTTRGLGASLLGLVTLDFFKESIYQAFDAINLVRFENTVKSIAQMLSQSKISIQILTSKGNFLKED